MPSNWEDYLKNDNNKRELFTFLSGKCLGGFEQLHIVTNVDDVILASLPDISPLNGVSCGSREEADGRVILHVRDMIGAGFTSVLVFSTDTDVVALCVSFFPKFVALGLRELWVLYGSGEKKRFIAAHKIAEALGIDKAEALRGFHAFTGCDSVSFFSSKGKKTAWRAWTDTHTRAFLAISQVNWMSKIKWAREIKAKYSCNLLFFSTPVSPYPARCRKLLKLSQWQCTQEVLQTFKE